MSDRDAEPDNDPDPRFDNWPVRRYDAYGDMTVERETPATEEGQSEQVDDVEWVGVSPSGAAGGAYIYNPENDTLHEGRFDRQNERIVLEEDSEVHDRREIEDDESLGDHLVEIGDDHGWNWLSSFAEDHLETHEHGHGQPDEDLAGHHLPEGFEHEHTEFQQRNVADSSDVDVAFFGSHTFADGTDRVHVLEREFGVTADEPVSATVGESPDEFTRDEAGDAATGYDDHLSVNVEERYLVAEEPLEDRRAGDANIVDRNEYELALDVDPSEPTWEADAEGSLKRWHRANLAPPETEEHRRVSGDRQSDY